MGPTYLHRREIGEGEMEQMQSMMSKMKPEDMAKWAGRAQKVRLPLAYRMATLL